MPPLSPGPKATRLPALLCVLVIPLALIAGGRLLAPAARRGPTPVCSRPLVGSVTRAQALGVYPGESLTELISRLGAPDPGRWCARPADTRRQSSLGMGKRHPGRHHCVFYHTTEGGLVVIRIHRERVIMVNVQDRDATSIQLLSTEPPLFSRSAPRDR